MTNQVRIDEPEFSGIWVIKYILLGRGTTISLNGVLYRPHSGHLYLIYGYGMFAYLIFMNAFFKLKRGTSLSYYLPVIMPFLIIFTMNTILGDLRTLFLFVLLHAKLIASEDGSMSARRDPI